MYAHSNANENISSIHGLKALNVKLHCISVKRKFVDFYPKRHKHSRTLEHKHLMHIGTLNSYTYWNINIYAQ